LTRKPYYSRENLSTVGLGAPTLLSGAPEVTTKVERQVIERVDRTLWSSDGEPGRYRLEGPPATTYSGNVQLPPSTIMDYHLQAPSPTSAEDMGVGGPNGYRRERIFDPRDDDFRRGGSTRTSKYKQKIEKARKEFLHGDTTAPYGNSAFALNLTSSDDMMFRSRIGAFSQVHGGSRAEDRVQGAAAPEIPQRRAKECRPIMLPTTNANLSDRIPKRGAWPIRAGMRIVLSLSPLLVYPNLPLTPLSRYSLNPSIFTHSL